MSFPRLCPFYFLSRGPGDYQRLFLRYTFKGEEEAHEESSRWRNRGEMEIEEVRRNDRKRDR